MTIAPIYELNTSVKLKLKWRIRQSQILWHA